MTHVLHNGLIAPHLAPPAAWFEEAAGKEQELDWGVAGALRDETIRETVRENAEHRPLPGEGGGRPRRQETFL